MTAPGPATKQPASSTLAHTPPPQRPALPRRHAGSCGVTAHTPHPTTARRLRGYHLHAPSPRTPATAAASKAAAFAAEATAEAEEDASIRVKIMLAESSGRLDLSECGLSSIPPSVFELEGLEDLSLAGNLLSGQLPEAVGRLTSLKRLQLAGNFLSRLPDSIGQLAALEGLWLHGNQLEALPEAISGMMQLTQLSLAGNRLERIPEGVGGLTSLRELSLSGNSLRSLPASIGTLSALTKLSLNGNKLGEQGPLPQTLSGLQALEELWLQGNPHLSLLPAELGQLPSLKQLSAADCSLEAVPPELGSLPSLRSLSLYGNRLQEVPRTLLEAPKLKHLWLEANPLSPAATHALLEAAPSAPALSSLGLDQRQLQHASPQALEGAASMLKGCHIDGEGPGYFKLELAYASSNSSSNGSTANGTSGGPPRARALVVAFGSAPGTPNWGGLLGRIRAGAGRPEEADFDVLYVVDPHRSWYRGGDEGYEHYESRLRAVASQYDNVVMIGDSMGATAALLFSHLATSVQGFCPQVCLTSSSIRPGQPEAWFDALRDRIMHSVASSEARMVVHVGHWKHDLDQACLLPTNRVHTQIYSIDSHRLALALDRRGRLEGVVRAAILQELGLPSGHVRLANLV